MNIKSLLIASAAALMAVSSAMASPIAADRVPDTPTQAYEDPFPGAAIGSVTAITDTLLAPQTIALGNEVGPTKTYPNGWGETKYPTGWNKFPFGWGELAAKPTLGTWPDDDIGMKKPNLLGKTDPFELAALPIGGLKITSDPGGGGGFFLSTQPKV